MTFDEYRQYDALGLAKLIRKKEVQASEILDIAKHRAKAVNPSINAIVRDLEEMAREMIGNFSEQAPFGGVPLLIKDLGLHVKGTAMWAGSQALKSYRSDQDSLIVQRLQKAGFLFIGKTNTPEFGLTPFTEPAISGPTRNPWNTEHTCGGSSGGSAAAVAAGVTPIATASDGGGSIRIPASCCGLFGMKPSRGRASLGMLYGELWGGAVVENCVSRSVRDSAAYLDAICGDGPGEGYVTKAPLRPYLEEVGKTPGQLRIAYSTRHVLGHTVHPACIAAVEQSAKLLEALGHQVEEADPPFRREDLTETFVTMVAGEVAAELKTMAKMMGRPIRSDEVELNTWVLGILGRTIKAADFAYERRQWNDIARRAGQFHQKYDLLLTPTLTQPPIQIGELANTAAENRLLKIIKLLDAGKLLQSQIETLADKSFAFIPFTPFANMTGQPAMSVPLHWSEEGLPTGVMFTARIGEEDMLYRLAGQLEAARPWFNKYPDL